MPVLNEFGEAGYQRVVAQLDAFAGKLGIPREIIRQFWNDTAHLPQTLDELKAWGMKPDREYGQVRYDQATGRWTPLATGPTPGKTPEQRGGFPHFITNEVGNAERFQQVDPSGNIFGGSWDPAYNAAHPELAGRAAGALGDDPAARQQIQGRSAQARPFDAGNYVGPSAGGFVSVVDGVPNQFGSQAEAENDYNARTGGSAGAPGAPAPPSTGAGASPSPSGAPPYVAPGTQLTNPEMNQLWIQLFNNSAQMAYNNARLRELEIPEMQARTEAQKEQLRLQAARDAWQKAADEARITGTYNGKPVLDAAIELGVIGGDPTLKKIAQDAALTGQQPGTSITARAAAAFAQAKAQNPAITGSGPEAAGIWQQVVPGLSPDQAARMAAAANQYYAATGQAMPDDVARAQLGRITGQGAGAFGTLTPEAQHQANQDAISALTLLSNLRGPENAPAYARALANLPDSIRSTIAGMQSLPLTARNPAQAGLIGDVTGQPGGPTMVRATPDMLDQTGLPERVGSGALPAGSELQMARGPTVQGGPAGAAVPTNPALGGLRAAAVEPAARAAVMPFRGPAIPAMSAPPQGFHPGAGPVPGTVPPGYGPRTTPAPAPLPTFAQTSPTDWGRTNEYAKQYVLGQYQDQGEDKTAILDAYRRSLPRATGPRTGRMRVA